MADQQDDFDLVYVCNPGLHGDLDPQPFPGRVTRAWLTLEADKGWVECDAAGVPVDAYGSKTKPELIALAEARGLPVNPKATKDELVAALSGQEA